MRRHRKPYIAARWSAQKGSNYEHSEFFNVESVITRKCKWNEAVSNRKCNSLWLLIPSLTINRSSIVDFVTMENVLKEARRWIWTYCEWNTLINASFSKMQPILFTFELDVLSDFSQGTTRSNSCIDMVFGRNVDHLSCMNYISYFSYHRPILSRPITKLLNSLT
jgi:hypothetical protein